MKRFAIAVLVSSLGTAGIAGADTYVDGSSYEEPPGAYSYAWDEPMLASRIGVDVAVGGGVAGFTDKAMRDTTSSDLSGLWDFRLSIGTHVPIGVDLSYVGTAADINAIGGQHNGTLIGTAAEGALRWNILPHSGFDPYLFGGVGWQRYDVTSAHFATAVSGMKASDDLVEFPMGVGLAFRDMSGFTVDLRGTFRATQTSDLMIDPRNGNRADLHSWEASGSLGYEF